MKICIKSMLKCKQNGYEELMEIGSINIIYLFILCIHVSYGTSSAFLYDF